MQVQMKRRDAWGFVDPAELTDRAGRTLKQHLETGSLRDWHLGRWYLDGESHPAPAALVRFCFQTPGGVTVECEYDSFTDRPEVVGAYDGDGNAVWHHQFSAPDRGEHLIEPW